MTNTSEMLIRDLDNMLSEGRNPNTLDLDTRPTQELLRVINQEDKKVAEEPKDETTVCPGPVEPDGLVVEEEHVVDEVDPIFIPDADTLAKDVHSISHCW